MHTAYATRHRLAPCKPEDIAYLRDQCDILHVPALLSPHPILDNCEIDDHDGGLDNTGVVTVCHLSPDERDSYTYRTVVCEAHLSDVVRWERRGSRDVWVEIATREVAP